jgi:hypothetical protein
MSDGEREPTAATMFPWMRPEDRRAAFAQLGYPASSQALSSPHQAQAFAGQAPAAGSPCGQSLLDDEMHGFGQFRFDSPQLASHAVRSTSPWPRTLGRCGAARRLSRAWASEAKRLTHTSRYVSLCVRRRVAVRRAAARRLPRRAVRWIRGGRRTRADRDRALATPRVFAAVPSSTEPRALGLISPSSGPHMGMRRLGGDTARGGAWSDTRATTTRSYAASQVAVAQPSAYGASPPPLRPFVTTTLATRVCVAHSERTPAHTAHAIAT